LKSIPFTILSKISASVPKRLGGIFDVDVKSERLEEVNRELEDPSVWNQPERAQALGKEKVTLEQVVNTIR